MQAMQANNASRCSALLYLPFGLSVQVGCNISSEGKLRFPYCTAWNWKSECHDVSDAVPFAEVASPGARAMPSINCNCDEIEVDVDVCSVSNVVSCFVWNRLYVVLSVDDKEEFVSLWINIV